MRLYEVLPFGNIVLMLLGLVSQVKKRTLAFAKKGIATWIVAGILIAILLVGIAIYLYVVPSPAPATTTTPSS